jgi:hypothetical protein
MENATATGDVWLKHDDDSYDAATDTDDVAAYEANTYRDGDAYRVEWYHTAVGQVSSRMFATYGEACAWLESEGFEDYST